MATLASAQQIVGVNMCMFGGTRVCHACYSGEMFFLLCNSMEEVKMILKEEEVLLDLLNL